MALAPSNMPNVSSMVSVAPYLRNIQQSAASIVQGSVDRKAAEDNRIFRQRQQANADRGFNNLVAQQGVTNAASQLAATRNDAYRTSVLEGQLAGQAADEAWRNGGSAAETARALAASQGVVKSQNQAQGEMVNQYLRKHNPFDSLSEGNQAFVEGSQEYQDARGSDHPSADVTGLSEQQQLIRSTEAKFRGNLASYANPQAIQQQIMDLSRQEGWTEAQTGRALAQGLEGFSKLSADEVKRQSELESSIFKARTDALLANGTKSKTGSSSNSGVVKDSDGINNTKFIQQFYKDNDVKEGKSIFGRTFDGGKVNLEQGDLNNILGALMEKSGVGEAFVLKALQYSGTVYDGVWDMPPEDLLRDTKRMGELVSAAQKFKGTGSTSTGTGTSAIKTNDLISAAGQDTRANQARISANGQYQQNSEAGRLASLQSMFSQQAPTNVPGGSIDGGVDNGLQQSLTGAGAAGEVVEADQSGNPIFGNGRVAANVNLGDALSTVVGDEASGNPASTLGEDSSVAEQDNGFLPFPERPPGMRLNPSSLSKPSKADKQYTKDYEAALVSRYGLPLKNAYKLHRKSQRGDFGIADSLRSVGNMFSGSDNSEAYGEQLDNVKVRSDIMKLEEEISAYPVLSSNRTKKDNDELRALRKQIKALQNPKK
jgi:hypothetical protein